MNTVMNENKVMHTLGEWKFKVDNETDGQTIFIYSPKFGGIAKIPSTKHFEKHEANAKLIVTSVNNHYRLIEALNLIIGDVKDWQEYNEMQIESFDDNEADMQRSIANDIKNRYLHCKLLLQSIEKESQL